MFGHSGSSGEAASSEDSAPDAEALEGLPAGKLVILQSFQKNYQKILLSFPPEIWPTTTKTGKHSYTVPLSCVSSARDYACFCS